ncbi:MAG: SecE/sec61-gamma family protein translocase subunit [Candidatus Nitrosocosmicus sp.]|uniref:SecE/sec61-gamma family protein translocase subunit n=1 Tax=Candidatus Nitrosocosmicus sp. FF01 TaxID=3397670 RepID=UPI0039E9DD48
MLSSIGTTVQRRIMEIFQTLKLAKKTSKDDYFTHLRLVLLAIGAVGGIGFVIKMIGELIFVNK